jgi:hypothetical protein
LIRRQRTGIGAAEIRSFAWIVSAGLVLLVSGGSWYRGHGFHVWPVAVAVLLVGLAYAMPRAVRPIYSAWMAIGHVLGWINSRIILGIIFYAVFVPIGLVRRMGGRGPIRRSPSADTTLTSYRARRSGEIARERMERPF